jgi:altronate hydrolase
VTIPRTLRLNSRDNIVVAVDAIAAGATAAEIAARARVPKGHKMAIVPIAEGEPIRKFGQIIGFASQPIAPGDWVHEHNVEMHDFARDYAFAQDARNEEVLPPEARATFEGFRRDGDKVGTRNYIAILTSVNCSASVARSLDIKGEGYEVLKRTQWGYASNPNVGGVVMVGLGCEGFQIARWKQAYGLKESDTFRSMTIQETGGTKKTVMAGVGAIRDMLPIVNDARRQTCSAAELTLALQCGGSDGYSGITANPALGAAVDQLVRHGGTAILSETPEIYGAEHLLTRRALNQEIGEKLVGMINGGRITPRAIAWR